MKSVLANRPRIPGPVRRTLLLMLLAVSLLAAVPALRPVLTALGHIDIAWVLIGIGLEVASCLSFVVLFPVFFDRLTARDARALAWTEMASGALLPGGGAGGLAVGGYLIHLTGAPTDWIIRRSGGLFFLTTAVNGAAIILAGLLLALGVPGPHALTLTVLPALVAALLTAAAAAVPRLTRARPRTPRWLVAVAVGIQDAADTTLRTPSWRLVGALGYLGFDIAVLWISLHALGEPVSIPALVLAYNIGYVANALPIPAGIGVLDAGIAGALLLYGVPAGHVAAAVIVYHAIAFWTPGLAGTVAYFRLRGRLGIPTIEPEDAGEDLTGAGDPSGTLARSRELAGSVPSPTVARQA